MKILVISRSVWKKTNSFGNTYSNFFSKMDNVEIANIFLADGTPDYEKNITAYYKVSEKEICKSVFKRRCIKNKIGKRIACPNDFPIEKIDEPLKTNFFVQSVRKLRWTLFFILREWAWKLGQVNKSDMIDFVKEFKPDVIFLPFYYAIYTNRIALFLKENFDIPIILEASIDIYTWKQFSIDPLFWIDRFFKRKIIREVIKKSSLLYVISNKQKKDYSNLFDIPCKILNKMPNTGIEENINRIDNKTTTLLYTGNIGDGRWKTLAKIADVLRKCDGVRLDIYTNTAVTEKMKVLLNIDGCSCLHPPVNENRVKQLQSEADILVHVESFALKNVLQVRYSISTKIMDYLCTGKCILAVCPVNVASYEYLDANNLAYLIGDISRLESNVCELVNNKALQNKFANNGKVYVLEELNEKRMREKLFQEIFEVVEKY